MTDDLGGDTPAAGGQDIRTWTISLRMWPNDPTIPGGTARQIRGDVAARLGAAYSIGLDLEFSSSATRRLLERWEDPSPTAALERGALWHASLVAYGRCFGGGKRQPALSAALVPASQREVHDKALALRNWIVSHAISGQEKEERRRCGDTSR